MNPRDPTPADLRHPLMLLALGFGTGLAPKAPGTFGTLAGVALFIPLGHLPVAAYVATVAVLLVAGITICGAAAARLGTHDHPAIVWDEVVGYLVTMIALPPSWLWMAAGFVAFRFFDILKPWPIGLLDRRVHGGLGIMLDDVLAGVFALGVLYLARVYLGL
ncbi:MAG: phosphatidylglycerophosphatase A [Gammaproteobacteria bacterium]|nr:phosphatidylglycerophosphatase A [Gammaproteobacteria bacterium]